jgi:hypothetical protein
LAGNLAHRDKLKKLSNENLNISIYNSVPLEEIQSSLIHHDLGWCYFSLDTENISKALLSKCFDFIQAGLVETTEFVASYEYRI